MCFRNFGVIVNPRRETSTLEGLFGSASYVLLSKYVLVVLVHRLVELVKVLGGFLR